MTCMFTANEMINGILLETYAYGTVTISKSCFEPSVTLWNQSDSLITTTDIYSPCNVSEPLMDVTTTTTSILTTNFPVTTTTSTNESDSDDSDSAGDDDDDADDDDDDNDDDWTDTDADGIPDDPLEMVGYYFAAYTEIAVIICIILFVVCVSCLVWCTKMYVERKAETNEAPGTNKDDDDSDGGGSKADLKRAELAARPTAGGSMDIQGGDERNVNLQVPGLGIEFEGVGLAMGNEFSVDQSAEGHHRGFQTGNGNGNANANVGVDADVNALDVYAFAYALNQNNQTRGGPNFNDDNDNEPMDGVLRTGDQWKLNLLNLYQITII